LLLFFADMLFVIAGNLWKRAWQDTNDAKTWSDWSNWSTSCGRRNVCWWNRHAVLSEFSQLV